MDSCEDPHQGAAPPYPYSDLFNSGIANMAAFSADQYWGLGQAAETSYGDLHRHGTTVQRKRSVKRIGALVRLHSRPS